MFKNWFNKKPDPKINDEVATLKATIAAQHLHITRLEAELRYIVDTASEILTKLPKDYAGP